MKKFEKVSQLKADIFLRDVGISLKDFLLLVSRIKAFIDLEKDQKLMKKRGKKSTIPIEDQLLLCLYYLRDYSTFYKLGKCFSISESYACKKYHHISEILVKVLHLPNRKALLDTPIATVVIDVSEQAIERPVKKQKQYYSGKKKDIPLRYN